VSMNFPSPPPPAFPTLPEPAANPLIFKGLRSSCGGSGAHYRASNRGVNIKVKFFLEMADAKVEHNTTTE
ncbi:hypothetical protein, partial [Azotobacter chroococcum]|uniref:hypothetical protein n=1 Tax=Azotobacter chroococcum TaxID=353 RepID=UPI001A9562F4